MAFPVARIPAAETQGAESPAAACLSAALGSPGAGLRRSRAEHQKELTPAACASGGAASAASAAACPPAAAGTRPVAGPGSRVAVRLLRDHQHMRAHIVLGIIALSNGCRERVSCTMTVSHTPALQHSQLSHLAVETQAAWAAVGRVAGRAGKPPAARSIGAAAAAAAVLADATGGRWAHHAGGLQRLRLAVLAALYTNRQRTEGPHPSRDPAARCLIDRA